MLLTVEDMVAMFGEEECLQIAGFGPRDARVLDNAKIAEAIGWASAIVSGYVRERYPAALTEPTALLKGFAADIARWRLRGKGGQQSAMNDVVKERYDEALARLKDIAAGRLVLDLAAPPAELAAAANETAVHSSAPLSRLPGMMEGY